MTNRREPWFDEAAGPLVRPYAVTRGRTGARHDLDMITLVVAAHWDQPLARMEQEYVRIVERCAAPTSVAEVSAHVGLPLAVTKILIGDLIDAGYLLFRSPPSTTSDRAPDLQLLQAVLDGVRKL
ncbi:hypothetical protein BLA60_05515 [Actinophytocola xinjiangensis]|uniref:DUF742 domain-containing protein n=1 Tax=Actinophytocola xinjiangensis TaxID=485602 RepID=A0A7Z0WPX9_9PSEU|nr:DUF742 domain-containing protein [Actinophytocola xinjiangensis]OLF12736.1 hypothetical protein BLA60_05515 [Actinophytocola xinjiangensis]